jgi:ATP-dependent DNA helicase DinG
VEGAVATLKGFAAAMHFVLDAQDPESVFWAEPAGRFWPGQASLISAPLKIAAALAERLYAKKTSVVFCSATLRVGGSFNYIGRRLGIDRIEAERLLTCVAESPFDYHTQCAALALTCLPEPAGADGGSYVEQLSGLMLDVFLKTRGRALGLFTSYEMMNSVGRLLEAPLNEAGIRLLVHGASGTRDQITRVFRSGAGGPSVLLGTHSFWEGVDVAGEALSCVVLARLPFTAVGDPIFEARCEQIEQSGGSSFRELSVPQAVIRFRQGFGRLIRTCSDRGVVIVADPRLVTRNYGAIFGRRLPCPIQPIQDCAALLTAVGKFFGVN